MYRLVAMALIVLLVSCKHDKIMAPALPKITIKSPSENQHFVLGETIAITGTITSDLPLAEVGVHMTDRSTDNEFFHNHYGVGNVNTYSFSATHIIINNSTTVFEVEVEAVDADGRSTIGKTEIKIN